MALYDSNDDDNDCDDDDDDDGGDDNDDDTVNNDAYWLLMVDDASIDTKFDDFAKRRRPTLGPTDTAAYRDAMDASKKYKWVWRILIGLVIRAENLCPS